MRPYRDLTDEEWQRVKVLLPELRPKKEQRGRPLSNTRAVLNGVLWVIYSGATWSTMPRRYPSHQTCHRRFKAWYDSGVLKQVLEELYGSAAQNLCDTIATRMRFHAKKKSGSSKEENVADEVRYSTFDKKHDVSVM